MRKGYKWICFLLVMLMLVSCSGKGNVDETPGTQAPVEETVAEDTGIQIVRRSVAQYSIVYAAGTSDMCLYIINSLAEEINGRTGATIQVREESDERDPEAKEILIGSTAYAETKTVSKSLSKKQYAIRAVDNKIVIVGDTKQALEEAIYCMIEQLMPRNMKQNGNRVTLYHEDFVGDFEEPAAPLFNGVGLEKYHVIYSKDVPGMEDLALKLTQRINSALKLKMESSPDTFVEESEYEILVGPTNRTFSAECFSDGKVPLMSRRLIIKGTKIQFASAGAYSATDLSNAFVSSFILGTMNRNLRDGVYLEANLMPVESQPLTEGATLRVMTSNILAEAWKGDRGFPTIAERAEMYAATLAVYRPDLVGAQETCKDWQKTLPYFLNYMRENLYLDYEWVQNKVKNSKGTSVPNMSSIIYLKDKFTLVDSGCREYSFVNDSNYKIRVCTWAIFNHKETNEKYGLFNTHWSFTSAEGSISVREECELINSKKDQYQGLHVFCTGDFNNHLNGSIELFKKTSGLLDSREQAERKGTLVNKDPGIPEGIYIDRVLFDSRTTVLRHETIGGAYTAKMSDHRLQYGDYLIG